MGTLDNLEISSGDYTFMTFWDASSMTIDSSTLHPLFGTDSTGMNFQVAKEGTTSAKLYHGTSSTCSATVTIESSWNHAAVVYSSSAQTSSFYINGVLASPTCSQFSTSGTTAYYGGGYGSTWTGSLEQAKLYTKAIGTDDLLNFSNWCSTYTCSAAYRRNSRRRTVCSTPSCSDSDCCEAWPTCDQNDCTVDWKSLVCIFDPFHVHVQRWILKHLETKVQVLEVTWGFKAQKSDSCFCQYIWYLFAGYQGTHLGGAIIAFVTVRKPCVALSELLAAFHYYRQTTQTLPLSQFQCCLAEPTKHYEN